MVIRFRSALTAVIAVASFAACKERPAADPAGNPPASASRSRSDELLLAAANVALPPGTDPADLPDPNSAGAKLVVKHCAQCHPLPTPLAHSATDWPGVARRMWLRTEWISPTLGVLVPTMGERYAMLEYLTANALRVSGASLPPGKGRESFQLICSRCHALPDPKVHSREDWPTVFARMERNMERMKVSPPSSVQTTDILLYLQTAATAR